MISFMVIVVAEPGEYLLSLPWEVVVLEFHHLLHGPAISLDLALPPGMIGCSADMTDAMLLQIFHDLSRAISGPVIREQPWTELHGHRFNSFYSRPYWAPSVPQLPAAGRNHTSNSENYSRDSKGYFIILSKTHQFSHDR